MTVRYKSYRRYLTKRFNKPVLKIALNGGFSCPNRDGVLSRRGCLFCDNRSFSPVYNNTAEPLKQLKETIDKFGTKFSAYLPYLQPFTNTYSSVKIIEIMYESLVAVDGVIGLAVGTRPDCLDNGIVDYLSDLNNRTYLSIELGLQSADDAVLSGINRGHTYKQFVDGVYLLTQHGISVTAHVMAGLPGETVESFWAMADKIALLPIEGIKIHQCMVIEKTELAQLYNDNKFSVLSLENYTKLLAGFITRLRPNQYIHRLMADSNRKDGLIAPLWSENKMSSLNKINEYFEKNNIVQGMLTVSDS